MANFEQTHADVLKVLPTAKSYKSLTQSGAVIEAYEKKDDKWQDVTLREQEKQRLERELAILKREYSKMMEAKNEENT